MLRLNWMGKLALGSLGVIAAAKLWGRHPDSFPVSSDFTPEELGGMLLAVREGRPGAFEAIYRHRLPGASQSELDGARLRFEEYIRGGG